MPRAQLFTIHHLTSERFRIENRTDEERALVRRRGILQSADDRVRVEHPVAPGVHVHPEVEVLEPRTGPPAARICVIRQRVQSHHDHAAVGWVCLGLERADERNAAMDRVRKAEPVERGGQRLEAFLAVEVVLEDPECHWRPGACFTYWSAESSRIAFPRAGSISALSLARWPSHFRPIVREVDVRHAGWSAHRAGRGSRALPVPILSSLTPSAIGALTSRPCRRPTRRSCEDCAPPGVAPSSSCNRERRARSATSSSAG